MFINIGLYGYGGEVVLGTVTKEAYDFWTTEEAEEHFSSYVWGPEWFVDDNPDFKIPEFAELPTWYEIEDRAHESGGNWDGCRLNIREMDGPDYESNEIREIYDDELRAYIDKHEIEVSWDEAYPLEDEYTFFGYSAEKGTFWEGTTEIPGDTFDPSKLQFNVIDINGDELVSSIEYEGVDYLNNDGGGTDGKSSGFELIGPTVDDITIEEATKELESA